MPEVTESIVREDPRIEAYKLGLLETAKQLSEKDLSLPAFQAAGLSDIQNKAITLGQQGIGAYAPFLQAGQQGVEGGIRTLGAAGQAISDVNVSPQFQAAQQAMGYGLGAAGQMAPYVAQMGYGTNLLGEGAGLARGASAADLGAAQGTLGEAARMTRGLSAADLGASQGMLGQAAYGTAGALGGYDPRMAQAYMDPYQQQVTRNAIAEMARSADIQSQGMAAKAAQAGAFGGTREGVQRAEFGRGLQDVMGQRIMEDMSRNYQQAQQAAMTGFEQQQQRQLAGMGQIANIGQTIGQQQLAQAGLGQQAAGQLANIGQTLGQQQLAQAGLGQQAAGLMGQLGTSLSGIYGQQAGLAGQQAGLYGQLGQGIGSLGAQYGQLGLQRGVALADIGQNLGAMGMNQAQLGMLAQQANQGDVNALLTLGSLQQATEQNRLDAFRATELQKSTSPFQRIAFLSDIYKGAPSTQMSLTGATAPTTSPFMQAAGLAVSGVATAAGAKRAGIF